MGKSKKISSNSKRKFKIGDPVVVLSLVSSVIEKSSPIFHITDYVAGMYHMECNESGNSMTAMRGEHCIIPARQVYYIGPADLFSGSDFYLPEGTVLTIKSEGRDCFLCFESGTYPIPKEYCKEKSIE